MRAGGLPANAAANGGAGATARAAPARVCLGHKRSLPVPGVHGVPAVAVEAVAVEAAEEAEPRRKRPALEGADDPRVWKADGSGPIHNGCGQCGVFADHTGRKMGHDARLGEPLACLRAEPTGVFNEAKAVQRLRQHFAAGLRSHIKTPVLSGAIN